MADPLETLLRPVANVLNRNIAETTPARDLLARLAGRTVAIRMRDTALAMYFGFDDAGVSLGTEFDAEPDVVVSGGPITLLRLAAGGDEGLSSLDGIDLSGDARVASAFQDILRHARPDLEEELSRYVGDSAAHGLGQFARAFGSWARDARSIIHTNMREYLQEERRAVPSRYETDRFAERVNALRDDVERLEARLNRLEAGR